MQAAIVHTKVPLLADVDVLIVGAGSAGCCAALAARESKKHSVMLVDRLAFAGGTSTAVLDTFYGFFTPGEAPRKVVGGLPDRVVNALDSTGDIFLRPNTYGAGTGVTYNPERLKRVWDQLLTDAGVKLLLHSFLVDVETNAAGGIVGVILATKGGLVRVTARRYIDASGDADLCHWAGIAAEKAGDLEPAQTLTTTFRMCNVDLAKFDQAGGHRMLNERMREAFDSGSHPLPRKKGSAHAMTITNCIATVAVRVADVDPTDVEQLTQAEVEGRRQSYIFEAFLNDRVPGYETAKIIGLSTQIGVRETRRVYGEYRLSRDDCLTARRFDDEVLLCGAPIEDHRKSADGEDETRWAYVPGNDVYGVPYRALVPKGRDEVWVVGRCFSATHDAHASCRSMGQTMSMGQAAGTAATMSLESDSGARGVDVLSLRTRLHDLGAVLEMPSRAADTTAQGWSRNL
jgi:hypothetical protein